MCPDLHIIPYPQLLPTSPQGQWKALVLVWERLGRQAYLRSFGNSSKSLNLKDTLYIYTYV